MMKTNKGRQKEMQKVQFGEGRTLARWILQERCVPGEGLRF